MAKSQPSDSGRNAWRESWEPFDGRPLVIVRREFYRDTTEQLTYENAVESNPRKHGEGPMAYVRRIAEIATGELLAQPAKTMPEARLPYREDE